MRPSPVLLFGPSVLVAALTAGCGGSDDATPASASTGGAAGSSGSAGAAAKAGSAGKGTAGTAGKPPFQTAEHGLPPQMPAGSGRVLATPQIVTVTFAKDGLSSKIQAFGDFIVQSDWLKTTGAEYGVGPGEHVAKVELTEDAPAQIGTFEVDGWLLTRIKNGTIPSPPNPSDNDWLYMIYFPSGTKVGDPGSAGCVDYGAYHTDLTSSSLRVAYAVMPRCGSIDLFVGASHELHEAATDPYPNASPAYRFFKADDPWTYLGGETGDSCFILSTSEGGYDLTRVYSSVAAAAGKDWCIPAPDAPMFGVYPSPSGVSKGKPGDTIQVVLEGWSDADLGPFNLDVYPMSGYFNPTPSLSSFLGDNGKKVTLELSIPPTAAPNQWGAVLVTATRSPDDFHAWPVAVLVTK